MAMSDFLSSGRALASNRVVVTVGDSLSRLNGAKREDFR